MKWPQGTLLAAATLLAANLAHAQVQFFGPWHDLAPIGLKTELYVSPLGDDATAAPDDPNLPFRTITRALEFARVDLGGAVPVTVNVFPGVYVAGAPGQGEQFPLLIPAHGVCLESIDVQDRVGSPVSIIGGGPIPGQQGAILFIDIYGNPDFPDSVVRGLDFEPTTAPFAIRMNPTGIPTNTAVQFIDNYIHGEDCLGGIELELNGARSSLEVLEGNWIVSERAQGGLIGVRIIGGSTVASPVLRSNQIARFKSNVEISGGLENCRPRLLSNTIQVSERNVSIAGAFPILTNNTIAYAFNFGATPDVTGIEGAGSVELINNLLWNPVAGSGAATAVDITGVNVVQRIATIDEDSAPPSFTPGFVSGDNHPGLALFGALPRCKDLHVGLGSPLIDAGDLIAVFDFAAFPPELPVMVVNNQTVRRDVNLDLDRDPRMLDGPGGVQAGMFPDIGADEVTDDTRIERTAAPAGGNAIDECGSLRASVAAGGQLDHLTAVQVTTPPMPGNIAAAFVFLGAGFEARVLAGGALTTNGGLFQNVLDMGLGQLALDLAPGNAVLIGSGFQLGGGAFPITIDTGVVPEALAEAEFYLQAFVGEISPAGALLNVRVSNRMYVELDR